MRTETDVIEIDAPTWDGIDESLAYAQAGVKQDGSIMTPREVAVLLTGARGDLAVLRATERAQQGTPVVARFLEPVGPAERQPGRTEAIVDTLAGRTAPRGGGLSTREVAMQKGYTGNFCDVCDGPNMVRNGTCERCQDCGATTGCS